MIRTILVSAALLAVAGVAQAGEIKVSLNGKTDAQIRTDVTAAAKLACKDVSVIDYAPCVQESAQAAMFDVAKIKAIKPASF